MLGDAAWWRPEWPYGSWGQVSTNAAEGLFGRVEKFYRAREKTELNQDSYVGLLAEYLWRQQW